jgi:hypothetical protein
MQLEKICKRKKRKEVEINKRYESLFHKEGAVNMDRIEVRKRKRILN